TTAGIEMLIQLMHDFQSVNSSHKSPQQVFHDLTEISCSSIESETVYVSGRQRYETKVCIENVASFVATANDQNESQDEAISKVLIHLTNLAKVIDDFKLCKFCLNS